MSTQTKKSWIKLYLDGEEPDRFQIDTLKALLREIWSYKGTLFIGIPFVILAPAAYIALPRIFGYAIDEAIVPKNWELLKKLVLLFLAVEIFRVLTEILYHYTFTVLGQKVMDGLRTKLFTQLQRLPSKVYDRIPSGKLVTRVSNDITMLSDMFTAGFVTIVGNLLLVLGIFGYLLVLDLRLGLIAGAVFPVLAITFFFYTKFLRRAYQNARAKLSALNGFLAENILGMKVVKLFNRERLHFKRFRKLNGLYTRAQMGSVRVYAYFQPTINWLTGVSVGLIIWFGGASAATGDIKVGILVTFFAYIIAVFQPIRETADNWNIVLSGMASADRIFSVLRWTPEPDLKEIEKPAFPIRELKGKIEFRNVSFAYQNENWILKDFNLVIQPGMKVGIVGTTGAGKSTLVNLLMRFYEIQKGQILIDDVDIRKYDKRSLRASLGMIQQDVFLFSGSVKDNISLWREGRGDLDQWIQDFPGVENFKKLPNGLETNLQERGNNLSMGQKQVVAFARAAYANPPIWILDEATSNIDSQTEAELNLLLEKISKNQTTLIIAHRLATVRNCDLILVMNEGQLVEAGKHAELIQLGGAYSKLYGAQREL